MPHRPITLTASGTPYAGDHSEHMRAVARMIRSAGKRAGSGDPVELVELLELRSHLELAIAHALVEQRERYSLGEIAAELGVSRPAVHKMQRVAEATIAELDPPS